MKTVTYKGNVYEIGKVYLFGKSIGALGASIDVLIGIDRYSSYPFKAKGFATMSIRELDGLVEIGTITPAPVELIDGQAYMFSVNGTWLGFYRSDRKSFFTTHRGGNKICGQEEALNIRKMVVAP